MIKKIIKKLVFKAIFRIKYFYLNAKFSEEACNLRYNYWNKRVKHIGRKTIIYGDINIQNPIKVIIGDCCTVNDGVFISARDFVTIGNNVTISARVTILTGGIDIKSTQNRNHISGEVKINNNVWIGANSTILPGIEIGEGCVIGAGSVVTKNLPSNSVCVGVPAKPIKGRIS